MIEIVRTGALATVQDLGRPGLAHLGVPGSGAADAPALRLANRLLGNPEDAAGVEATFGGLAVRATRPCWIAVTGAPLPLRVGGRAAGTHAPCWVAAGATVELGIPEKGLRSYLAVRGGLVPAPVLGSRATDLLSRLGPAPLRPGDVVPVGPTAALPPPTVDAVPPVPLPDEPLLHVVPGPRDNWFADDALTTLTTSVYTVTQDANRVGVRLDGPAPARARAEELPSEGMVTGALQIPPGGTPILFLADHPTTGGYPVAAVVTTRSLPLAAQLRPGQRLRFTRAR